MEYPKFYMQGRHERTASSVDNGAFIASVEILASLMPVYLDGQASKSYEVPTAENPWETKRDKWARAAWLLGYQSIDMTFEALLRRVSVANHQQVVTGRIASRALVDAIEDTREAEAAKAVAA